MPLSPPPSAQNVVAYLNGLRHAHASLLPGFGREKVLSFMGTTASAGRAPAMAIARVLGIEAPPEGGVRIRLEGRLPRAPAQDERIAVSLSDPERFFGFQVKSAPLTNPALADRIYE